MNIDDCLSRCCDSPMQVSSGEDFGTIDDIVTSTYVCTKCDKPCDWWPPETEPLYFPEEMFRKETMKVRQALADIGKVMTLKEAENLWREYSQQVYAGYVSVPQPHQRLMEVVKGIVKEKHSADVTISKEQFCEWMNRWRSLVEDTRGVYDALKKLEPDFNFFCLTRHDQLIGDLLREIMGDNSRDSWISYYVYELDWGQEGEKFMVKTAEGKVWHLTSPEILFDFLKENE